MRSLLDILVCPACKGELRHNERSLACATCATDYPVRNGVPIFLPGIVPEFERELPVRPGYSQWKERLLIKSLRRDQVALDFGCGYQELDDPNIVRVDAALHPYVDVVGDLHHLPFRDDSIHLAFGGAVFEHLKEPRSAAAELWRCLAPGGYLYADWNFVFAYHGFPAHYFNASIDGVREVFDRFRILETGVAPFQGPGAALRQVVGTYLETFAPSDDEGKALRDLLQTLLLYPLEGHDRSIAVADRHRVAAGIYLVAIKDLSGRDSILSAGLLQRWAADERLREQFPEPRNIAQIPNLLAWAEVNAPGLANSLAAEESAEAGESAEDASEGGFSKSGSARPRHAAIAVWPWALLAEPEPTMDEELRRAILARRRPATRKVRDLLRSPMDILRLPNRAARYAFWKIAHLMGRAP
jgi:uncharacterized protein YbaR (Trm112 family)